MQAKTTRCSLHGQPEFLANYDEQIISKADVQLFLADLENTVAEGQRYHAGETVQIGWMVLSLQETPEGELLLLEPDMQGVPINFIPSVDRTLHHQRLQRYTAESLGLDDLVAFPSILQSAIVCGQLGKDGFLLDRTVPEGHGSGWFVGCNDPGHEHEDPATMAFLSLYEIGCRFPSVIPFLALPPKSSVTLDSAGRLEVVFDGEHLPAKEGSYLKAKYGS